MHAKEESMNVGLSREDEHWWSKWIVGINLIGTSLTSIWPLSLARDTTGFQILFFYFSHSTKCNKYKVYTRKIYPYLNAMLKHFYL